MTNYNFITKKIDVLIIGAGAAGLMCAIQAGKRGRCVMIIDHNAKPAEKIRISGGGRCNFTNLMLSPKNFISNNPHFMKSALSRFTPQDFITMLQQHNISYHEKTLGQLFCDHSARDIIDMLLHECHKNHVRLVLKTGIESVHKEGDFFKITLSNHDIVMAEACVIATGGLSIPKMGATSFGYTIAKQFEHTITELTPALVPFVFTDQWLDKFKLLSGLSVDAEVKCHHICFREGLLFTHRGISGPSILQISSYWQAGEKIEINFLPGLDLYLELILGKTHNPKMTVKSYLSKKLPVRLLECLLDDDHLEYRLGECKNQVLRDVADSINQFIVKPSGTEGYRTAEVTLGGVSCDELSSKTFESMLQKNLYFIGEVVDVTGWLGGYNFQWAWSSGWCCGQVC